MIHRIAIALVVALVSSTAAAQIPLTVDSTQSSVLISVSGVSDESTLSGTSEIILTPTSEPFEMAQITEMDIVLADGFNLSILGGLVSASTPPGDTSITMTIPGPAGVVDGANTFDQLANESTSEGTVTINDPFNLAGGSQVLDLSTNPPAMFDMLGVQLAVSGDQLTVTAEFTIETVLDNGLTLTVDGTFVATGTVPSVTTVSVAPDTLTRSRGVIISGAIEDLEFSDDADVTMRRNPTGVVSITEFEVSGNSSITNPTEMEFTLEASVFARTTVNQTISLFDYVAGDWVAIDTRASARFSDAVVTVAATGDLTRFVDANGDIQARVTYLSVNPRQQFASNSDQVLWTITGN